MKYHVFTIFRHKKGIINILPSFRIVDVSQSCQTNFVDVMNRQFHEKKLLHSTFRSVKSAGFCSKQSSRLEFPCLTSFPVIYWPSFVKYAKNTILSRFIISKFYDKKFSLDEFIVGSKHAVGVVSDCLSRGDFKNLDELVAPDVLEELRRNLLKFSFRQVLEIKINPGDIYLSFPYEVGIMFPDDNDNSKRFVEITMCYHVLAGYQELSRSPEFTLRLVDFEEKLYVLNYRFFKDFSIGKSDSPWIINALNHNKPLISDVYF